MSQSPDPLLERLAALYTPVVADVLDRLGLREQCLRAEIRPLAIESRIAGRVRTVRCVEVDDVNVPEPYKGEMEAVDSLRPGDVLVVSRCDWSFWGELLSTAATYRGAHGVVIDGYTRDSAAIVDMGFPVFCRGVHPADSLGRIDVDAVDVPIHCGGIAVDPGDFLLADRDGVVIIPARAIDKTLARAEEKVSGENLVRQKLAEGMSVSEAFRTYGIL